MDLPDSTPHGLQEFFMLLKMPHSPGKEELHNSENMIH